ncbi:MAG: PIN domain-containing protein [Candidatus Bathyarchaeia archaeon]
MKAVIDTRFFIVHFLAEDEETKSKTRRILESLQREASIGFVPTIVVHELYKFEMENFGRDVADMRVNAILKSKLKVVDLDSSTAIEAARMRCKYADLPMADAIIAATAIRTSSDFVLTDDRHIKQIKEVKTKWI